MFRGVYEQAFHPVAGVPQVSTYHLGSAMPGSFPSILAPVDLQGGVPRVPIAMDGLLQQVGLLDDVFP